MVHRLLEAGALIVGTPTYKASYTGLLKHLVGLLDPSSLRDKPILLVATGGGERRRGMGRGGAARTRLCEAIDVTTAQGVFLFNLLG